MRLKAILDLMKKAENPEEALKEHIAKRRSNACNIKKNRCITNKSLQNKPVTSVTPKKTKSELNISPKKIAIIRQSLTNIGEPEEDHYIVIKKCRYDPETLAYYLEKATEHEQEKRQQKVLSMLADNPDKNRVYVTDTETDQDNVIITVAIREVAMFELMIPKMKCDPFLLTEIINNEALQ